MAPSQTGSVSMHFQREGFVKTLTERVEGWDYERLDAFLTKNGKEIKKKEKLALYWDDCHRILTENLERLSGRIPENGIYDDNYMARLFVVIYGKTLDNVLQEKEPEGDEGDTKSTLLTSEPKISLESVLPGDFIGDYEIIEVLGEGAMGVVYLAQHRYLMRRFAVKVMSSQFSSRPEFEQIFLHEARTLGNLKHPNLVEVHNFGVHEGAQYLVMEYIKAGTMTDYIKRNNGVLKPSSVISVMDSVLQALSHAHAHNVIHRDLKPDNFMLGDDGAVKISDFGIAFLCDSDLNEDERLANRLGDFTDEDEDLEQKEDGTWVRIAKASSKVGEFAGGTKGYMAPEVASGMVGDKRSDYYAIGVIIYQFLTGMLPDTKKRQPATELVANLDPRWNDIIDKCMIRRPDNRYQSAEAILKDLRALSAPAKKPTPEPKPSGGGFKVPKISLPKIPFGKIFKTAIILGLLGGSAYFFKTKYDEDPNFIRNLTHTVTTTVEDIQEQVQTGSSDTYMPPSALVNGSFENALSGWNLENFHPQLSFATYAPDQAIDGDHFVKLLPSDNNPGWARISTPVTAQAVPGNVVHMSAWVRVESASQTEVILLLRGLNSARTAEVGSSNASITATGNWQEIEHSFQIPTDAQWSQLGRLEIEIVAPSISGNQPEIQVDNVHVDVGDF